MQSKWGKVVNCSEYTKIVADGCPEGIIARGGDCDAVQNETNRSMQEFDYQLRPRIIFGPHTVQRLGSLARELGCARALVVWMREFLTKPPSQMSADIKMGPTLRKG